MSNKYDLTSEMSAFEEAASLKEARAKEVANLDAIAKHLATWINSETNVCDGKKVLATVPIYDGLLRTQCVTIANSGEGGYSEGSETLTLDPVAGGNIKAKIISHLTQLLSLKYKSNQNLDSVSRFKEANKEAKVLYKRLEEENFLGRMMGMPAQSVRYQTTLRRRYTVPENAIAAVKNVKDGYTASWTHGGEVIVQGGRYNTDPLLDIYYNKVIEVLFPNAEDRGAFLNFFALAVFDDRTGRVRPILYLHGIPDSGKSLALQLIRRTVGEENSKSMKADSKRFGIPDRALVYYDETPDDEQNSKKDFWQHLKKIAKTTSPSSWEEKNVKAINLLTGSYAVVASNHMAVAAGAGDEVDAVVGITLTDKRCNADFVIENEEGTGTVDLYNYIKDSEGVPKAFIEKTLLPRFIKLKNENDNRYGMPMYQGEDFKAAMISDYAMNKSIDFENIRMFCRWVATFRKYKHEELWSGPGYNIKGFLTRPLPFNVDMDTLGAMHMLVRTEDLKSCNFMPFALLKHISNLPGNDCSLPFQKMLANEGFVTKKYLWNDYKIHCLSPKDFSMKKRGVRGCYLPAELFVPHTVEEYREMYAKDDRYASKDDSSASTISM